MHFIEFQQFLIYERVSEILTHFSAMTTHQIWLNHVTPGANSENM